MTWEEFKIQAGEYFDFLDELQEKLEGLSQDAETLIKTTVELEGEQKKIIYGDASKEYIAGMEKALHALSELDKKRKARIDKQFGKTTEKILHIFDTLPKPLVSELNILFEVVREMTETLREMEPRRRDISGVLQLLEEAMETIQAVKKHLQNENRLTPDQATIYTKMQNILFENYNLFLDEKKQREQEDELLTDEVRLHLEKSERMPAELKQVLQRVNPMRTESIRVYKKACDLLEILSNSEERVRKVEQTIMEVIKTHTCTEEELMELSAAVEENITYFSVLIVDMDQMKETTPSLISSISKTTEALRYFAAEM